MTGFTQRTHLERLLQWRGGHVIPPAEVGHGKFASALLPTRRFGPPAWVSFLMGVSPKSTTTGDFAAWVLYDARSVALTAYLGRPLADTFGVVSPFELPAAPFDSDEAAALGAVGDAFFAGQPMPPETEQSRTYLRSLSEGYQTALRSAAPDFLQWVEVIDG